MAYVKILLAIKVLPLSSCPFVGLKLFRFRKLPDDAELAIADANYGTLLYIKTYVS